MRTWWGGSLILVAVACGRAPSPVTRASPPTSSEIPISRLADGDAKETDDAVCRMIDALHEFGTAAVTDCGWVDLNRIHDPDAPTLAAVERVRACAVQALAAHASFVLVWRDRSGDPVCDDMDIQSNPATAHCGYQLHVQTKAIVGIRKPTGYAMYSLISDADTGQDSWTDSDEPAVQHTSSTEIERCARLALSESCDPDSLRDCFDCESSDDNAKSIDQCQSAPAHDDS
jgi:hypothetical protein